MRKLKTYFWMVAVLTFGYFVFISVRPGTAKEGAMPLIMKSNAFDDEGEIPAKYTCEGGDIAPSLEWEGAPENAKSLVLIVDDPDAPDPAAPKRTWVHWVVYNIPPETTGFPEGVTPEDLPDGAQNGINDWKRPGYGGPCPPIGRHRYYYKLYALDTLLEGLTHPTKAKIEAAMEGHIIEESVLMGTYQKSK